MSSDKYSDIELVEMIKRGGERRSLALKIIYNDRDIKPKVLGYLISKGVSKEGAMDILHDAIICADQNIRIRAFTLTSKLSTYIIGISRIMWLEQLRRDGKEVPLDAQLIHDEESIDPEEVETLQDKLKKEEVSFLSVFQKLSPRCIEGFKYRAEGYAYEEIGRLMKLKYQGVANLLDRCRKQFKSIVAKIPGYYDYNS